MPAAAHRVWSRLGRHGPALLLAATSAALAYLLASRAFGADHAFFAPIAAVVCVGLTAGQRVRRAVEIAGGVIVGLVAADVLVRAIGTGPWQLGVAVLVATAGAVALGAGPLMSNQAAVAAILVVAVSPASDRPWVRLGDALIGAAVALVANAVAAPDPTRAPRRAAGEALGGFVEALGDVAAALATADLGAAEAALGKAERATGRLGELDEAVAAAVETARLARHRRRTATALQPLRTLSRRLEPVGVTARAISRAAANAVRHGQRVDERVVAAVGEVAVALDELGRWVAGDGDVVEARARAVDAAATASAVLDQPVPTTVAVLVAQIRSAAVDVLRASGHDQRGAVAALEAVAGRVDRPRVTPPGDRVSRPGPGQVGRGRPGGGGGGGRAAR